MLLRYQIATRLTKTRGGAAVSVMHYDANDYVAEKRRALEGWENLLLKIVAG